MNRERRKDRFMPPIMGGSSLLIIFAVLCLTTFAVLSLSSVKANERLAEKSREAVEAYYIADYEAESILAQIRMGEIPDQVEVNDDIYSYACRISDTQELQVKIRYDGTEWEVLQWTAVSTVEWDEEDDSMNVWDGTDPSLKQEETEWN